MAKSNKDVKQDLKEALLKKALGYEIEEREAIAGKSGKGSCYKTTCTARFKSN